MNELNMSEKQIARQNLYDVGIELYGLSYDLHRDDCEMENSRPKHLMSNKEMLEWERKLVYQPNCVGCEVTQMANKLHSYGL